MVFELAGAFVLCTEKLEHQLFEALSNLLLFFQESYFFFFLIQLIVSGSALLLFLERAYILCLGKKKHYPVCRIKRTYLPSKMRPLKLVPY